MTETPTSYSLLVMYKDVIYAVRDPYGNRPLSIGRLVPISKLHSSGVWFSSEGKGCRGTCGLTVLYLRSRMVLNSFFSSFFYVGAGEADTEGWVVSSESCSFQSIGAKYVYIIPKEMLWLLFLTIYYSLKEIPSLSLHTVAISYFISLFIVYVFMFLLSGIIVKYSLERSSRSLKTEWRVYVLSHGQRETLLPSAYLSMFTLPGQTPYLKASS